MRRAKESGTHKGVGSRFRKRLPTPLRVPFARPFARPRRVTRGHCGVRASGVQAKKWATAAAESCQRLPWASQVVVASPCSPYSWYSLDSWSTRKGRTTKDPNPTNGKKRRSSERIQLTSDREYTIARAIHQWHKEKVFHYDNRSPTRARWPAASRAGCGCRRRRTAGCAPRWPRGRRVRLDI